MTTDRLSQADKNLSQSFWFLIALFVTLIIALSASVAVFSPLHANIGGWTATTPLPQPLASRNLVVHGEYIFLVGGKSAADAPVADVYAARIQADGALSSWRSVAQLPIPVYLHAVAATDSYLYVVGGWDGSRTRAEVWRAPFTGADSLGPFQQAGTYPVALDLHEAVIVQNRLYVLGGWNGNAPLNNVYYAELQDGGLGPWVAVHSLPKALYRLSAVAYLDRIYVTGGFDNASTDAAVYFATVQPDGSLSPWQTTTALPLPMHYHETVLHDGRLVVLGGRGDATEYSNVFAAPIGGDGSLGSWSAEPDLPESLYRFAAVSVTRNGSNYLYLVGGLHGVDYRATVYHSAFPAPPTPTDTPTTTPSPTPPAAALDVTLQNTPLRWIGPGEEIVYTITYHNASGQTAENVTIANLVPAHVELIPNSIQVGAKGTYTFTGVQSGATLRWSLGSLAPDAQGEVSYRVRRPPPTPPAVPRALAISKSAPAAVQPGALITYTIVVTNNTPFSLTNLAIVDTLPEGATFVRAHDNARVGAEVAWNVPILLGDKTVVRQFAVRSEQTLVNSNYYVTSDEGPTAKGRQVVITHVNGTDPPPSGDGVAVFNPGVTVTWEAENQRHTKQSNAASNPAFRTFLPLAAR